jgi:hypothetical protein
MHSSFAASLLDALDVSNPLVAAIQVVAQQATNMASRIDSDARMKIDLE